MKPPHKILKCLLAIIMYMMFKYLNNNGFFTPITDFAQYAKLKMHSIEHIQKLIPYSLKAIKNL